MKPSYCLELEQYIQCCVVFKILFVKCNKSYLSDQFSTMYHLNTVEKGLCIMEFVKVQSHALCFSVTTLALPLGTEFIHWFVYSVGVLWV